MLHWTTKRPHVEDPNWIFNDQFFISVIVIYVSFVVTRYFNLGLKQQRFCWSCLLRWIGLLQCFWSYKVAVRVSGVRRVLSPQSHSRTSEVENQKCWIFFQLFLELHPAGLSAASRRNVQFWLPTSMDLFHKASSLEIYLHFGPHVGSLLLPLHNLRAAGKVVLLLFRSHCVGLFNLHRYKINFGYSYCRQPSRSAPLSLGLAMFFSWSTYDSWSDGRSLV